jgi:ParB family chromosome partitioning protein
MSAKVLATWSLIPANAAELVTLGDQLGQPSRQPHQRKMVAPKAKDLADRLSDHFETRVKVELGRTKGKIIIAEDALRSLGHVGHSLAPRWGLDPGDVGEDLGRDSHPNLSSSLRT